MKDNHEFVPTSFRNTSEFKFMCVKCLMVVIGVKAQSHAHSITSHIECRPDIDNESSAHRRTIAVWTVSE